MTTSNLSPGNLSGAHSVLFTVSVSVFPVKQDCLDRSAIGSATDLNILTGFERDNFDIHSQTDSLQQLRDF